MPKRVLSSLGAAVEIDADGRIGVAASGAGGSAIGSGAAASPKSVTKACAAALAWEAVTATSTPCSGVIIRSVSAALDGGAANTSPVGVRVGTSGAACVLIPTDPTISVFVPCQDMTQVQTSGATGERVVVTPVEGVL